LSQVPAATTSSNKRQKMKDEDDVKPKLKS
jgi:hypothetical protein